MTFVWPSKRTRRSCLPFAKWISCWMSAIQPSNMSSILLVSDMILCKSVKLLTNEVIRLPVLPPSLEHEAVEAAHLNTGHGSWKVMYWFLQSRVYFQGFSSKCQHKVTSCGACQVANTRRCPPAAPSTVVIHSQNSPLSISSTFHSCYSPSRQPTFFSCLQCFFAEVRS